MKNIHAQKTNKTWALAAFVFGIICFTLSTLHAQFLPADKVRQDFKALLERPSVAPAPSIQSFTTDSVVIEKGYFYSEANEKVPVLIYKPVSSENKKLPVVICLHGTGGSKDQAVIKNLLYRFSKLNFMAVAIDGRYFGERSGISTPGQNPYNKAIVEAWRNKDNAQQEYPFFYDTAYDLWKLVDYLVTRPDVEPARIGMMGISKGGIETWMAASVDTRIKVAVPVIAAQSFKWSLENDRWQGRAKTIQGAHDEVARDLGEPNVNAGNVKKLWEKVIPGITDEFDCPSMIRLFAPRPLLLLSTENDQNCPLPGALLTFEAATNVYKSAGALDKLKTDVEPNQPHRFTPKHTEMTIEWFKKWL